ncbi:GNAT family N-acetyltransferase [Ornithinibacillus xuwenensis]|uniref:GNAT family N-acetyltransferase n=1 Tax=Ornithinibacillus xuwenensis TaxID=3144668 RepID=A0ABU9XCY2_9BACI
MVFANVQMTSRMKRIIMNAEKETLQLKNQVLTPEHLLLACLNEKSGALRDLYLNCSLNVADVRMILMKMGASLNQELSGSEFFTIDITKGVVHVMEAAIDIMKRYNQIYLNEGHLLKALLATGVVDYILSEEDKELILTLGTTARDMITKLGNYTFPKVETQFILKDMLQDKLPLVAFVEKNFSSEWSQTINGSFSIEEPNVYISFNDQNDITGFAAYDVYKNKKGYFGPMGVASENRLKGIGYSLLHHCLNDMKAIGYEYAIIGGAGPIEFYEKACHAIVIPIEKSY